MDVGISKLRTFHPTHLWGGCATCHPSFMRLKSLEEKAVLLLTHDFELSQSRWQRGIWCKWSYSLSCDSFQSWLLIVSWLDLGENRWSQRWRETKQNKLLVAVIQNATRFQHLNGYQRRMPVASVASSSWSPVQIDEWDARWLRDPVGIE